MRFVIMRPIKNERKFVYYTINNMKPVTHDFMKEEKLFPLLDPYLVDNRSNRIEASIEP